MPAPTDRLEPYLAENRAALLGFVRSKVGGDALSEDEEALCACFEGLLPTLKPDYAERIEQMDLGGTADEAMAERLGITRTSLKVRHRRARQQLRRRLEETCRPYSEHGCLDCTCGRSTA